MATGFLVGLNAVARSQVYGKRRPALLGSGPGAAHWQRCASLEEVAELCADYLREQALSPRDWPGAVVLDDQGAVCASVSRSGTIWVQDRPGHWHPHHHAVTEQAATQGLPV